MSEQTQNPTLFDQTCQQVMVKELDSMLNKTLTVAKSCLSNMRMNSCLSDYGSIPTTLYHLAMDNASVREKLAERLLTELGIPETQWALDRSQLFAGEFSIYIWLPVNYLDVHNQVMVDQLEDDLKRVSQAAARCLAHIKENGLITANCVIPWHFYQKAMGDERVLKKLGEQLQGDLGLPQKAWRLDTHPNRKNTYVIFVELIPKSD